MTCCCRNLCPTLLVCPTLINLPTAFQNILDLRGNKHLKNRNIRNLHFENVFKKVSTNLFMIPTFGKQYTTMVLK